MNNFENTICLIVSRFKADLSFHIFLIVWFVINILQGAFTGIFHDETYYWMYSENLAWGYFDHPPMIALLIKLGYWIIPNELGIRLFTILLSTSTLYIIYHLIDTENKSAKWFIIIILSIILIHSHICGFLAIPDIPLIFFTSLFFYLYKKFLEKETYKLAILLALTIALMLYSKYHGILILFFTILSNWKIILKPKFWVIVFFSVLFYIPHIYWQIVNDLPSVKYHLQGRSDAYSIMHTINFIYSQLIIAGPFIGFILLFFAFKSKPQNVFEKSLKYSLVGFYLFFFLSSFKGHTEAHWLASVYIPLIVLSYQEIINKPRVLKWCKIIFYPSIIIFIVLRIYLVYDFLPKKNYKSEMHHWKNWASDIEKEAGDLPVIFMNSYQRASKYTFYTKKTAHSLNNIFYRKNQYDLWNIEEELQGKDVLIVFPMYAYPLDTLRTSNNKVYKAGKVENFRSYNKVLISILQEDLRANVDTIIEIPVKITNNYNIVADFRANPELNSVLSYTYFQKNEMVVRPVNIKKYKFSNLEPGESYIDTIKINTPEKAGKYDLILSIKTAWFPTGLNGEYVKIIIEE